LCCGLRALVLTDSVGYRRRPTGSRSCLTLRGETEWVETVGAVGIFGGSDSEKIVDAVSSFSPPDSRPALYGDGAAADKCVDLMG